MSSCFFSYDNYVIFVCVCLFLVFAIGSVLNVMSVYSEMEILEAEGHLLQSHSYVTHHYLQSQ